MKRLAYTLVVAFLGYTASPLALAQNKGKKDQTTKTSEKKGDSDSKRHAGDRPLIVDIDNPEFRKLVMAIPQFKATGGEGEKLRKLAEKGASELGRLLNFSGLFNIMDEAAYQELLAPGGEKGSKSKGNKKNEKNSAGEDSSAPGGGFYKPVSAMDFVQWKALGVEGLTVGSVERQNSGKLTVTLKTVDVYKQELLVGKKYTNVPRSQFIGVIKRYADWILKTYTGKPGIFSSKIVFVGRRTKESSKQIYLCDFDGSNVKQLTTTKSPHLSPSISPDGRYVTFTSYEDGNPDLYRYELATGRKKKISGREGLNSGSHWSHNGKVVAFTGSHKGDADIFVTDPGGGNASPLIRGVGLDVDPAFSPEGKWLAFVSGRFGNPHIFRATLKWSGDKVRVLKDKRLTYAGWYNATPAWSPDGEKIAFAGYDKEIDRFDLFMMDPDGKKLERMTLRAGDNENPSFSPNGQLIVFQSNRVGDRNVKGQAHLYIMNRDGSGQRRLKTGLYEEEAPGWGPPMN